MTTAIATTLQFRNAANAVFARHNVAVYGTHTDKTAKDRRIVTFALGYRAESIVDELVLEVQSELKALGVTASVRSTESGSEFTSGALYFKGTCVMA